jgi:hypothetical protein
MIVDIEGAERRMLDGASSLLGMSPKPVWMVEISIGEHQPKGVTINPDLFSTFELFWRNGYEAWTTSRPYRAITIEEVKRIVVSGQDRLNSHNFLFVESGKTGFWREKRQPKA